MVGSMMEIAGLNFYPVSGARSRHFFASLHSINFINTTWCVCVPVNLGAISDKCNPRPLVKFYPSYKPFLYNRKGLFWFRWRVDLSENILSKKIQYRWHTLFEKFCSKNLVKQVISLSEMYTHQPLSSKKRFGHFQTNRQSGYNFFFPDLLF